QRKIRGRSVRLPDIEAWDGRDRLAVNIMEEASPWLGVEVGDVDIRGMISQEEKQYYSYLPRFFSGQGEVVELGPWLGASTHYIVEGLKTNPSFKGKKLAV